MIKVKDIVDDREYTVSIDHLHGMFFVLDECREIIDEGSAYTISDGIYYGIESTYVRE